MTDTPASTPSSSRRRRLLVPIVVTLVAALVALLAGLGPIISGGSDQPAADPAATQASGSTSEQDAQIAALAALARRTPGDPVALGEEDAPVVLINYSEFQCPFCGKFARDTKPTLVKEYVDKGLLRIEWRDFPYLGEESATAAYAGQAAAVQGRFWEFHDAMFADQQPPNSGRLTRDYLAGIAAKIGIDVERFRRDMANPQVQANVGRDFSEGQNIGVTGTPAFLINGNPIIGAQPTETFTRLIEAEVGKAQAK